jgi:nitrite reductase/ring-hydroxylating ferredoxin subunit
MQLEAVAHASQKWADGTLRATHEQGLVVTNIPAGFRDALATHIAGMGLSPHGDTLDRNTVACTGKQFCNIGVTETKSHMLQLVEKLRRRALALHGIRIHMSGCPASCAQHHTADIGLKGVRVRRREGTREGFDVYLGGGVAGHVRLGLPYKLGVDADQLPQLIEDVVREYYQQHLPGYTFSAYWFEKLQGNDAAKVVDGEYQAPLWLCESCQHQHVGIDPPVFCPKCSALRRNFARLEDDLDFADDAAEPVQSPRTADGYLRALPVSALVEGEGRSVELEGQEYAVFLIEGQVYTIDNACPHAGGPLAQGQVEGHTVSCPWHGWTFNACSGCSLAPAGHDVRQYETRVEDGTVFIRTPRRSARGPAPQRASSSASRPRAASNGSRTAAPVSMS